MLTAFSVVINAYSHLKLSFLCKCGQKQNKHVSGPWANCIVTRNPVLKKQHHSPSVLKVFLKVLYRFHLTVTVLQSKIL